MKNLYFKLIILFIFLICFSANMVSAITLVKAKTYINETNENHDADKSAAEDKLAAIVSFNFQSRNSTFAAINRLKVYPFKFDLPMSYNNLPDRPPRQSHSI